MAKRSFTPRSSDSLLFGAVSRGDDGKFLSVDIGISAICDDECDDGESYIDIALLNPRHPNGAFYMAHMESAEERTTRLMAPRDQDLNGFEIHLLDADDMLVCAGGDPLEFAILRQEVQIAREEIAKIEAQHQADEDAKARAAHFQAVRRNRRARRQAAIAQA